MKRKRYLIGAVCILIVALLLLILFLVRGSTEGYPDKTITVTSSAFEEGGTIPVRYTGNGEDVSPPLTFAGMSADAVSLAVVMDDLDFPLGTYNHWVLWNISVTDTVPEAVPHGGAVDTLGGAVQGVGYGKNRYSGPKPPFGSHRYVFRVYVLDTTLDLPETAGKKELLGAIEGHILGYGELMGRYR